MSDGIEKRKHPRVDTHIPVRYRRMGDPEDARQASTISKNLSEGGVRFKAPEFVSRACRLILELDMPMLTHPIRAISKVAWIRKAASEGDFEVGNQFLEMSKSDRKSMNEYVESLSMYNDPGEEGEAQAG